MSNIKTQNKFPKSVTEHDRKLTYKLQIANQFNIVFTYIVQTTENLIRKYKL